MLSALIILDGYGYSDNIRGNAVSAANTPVLDRLWEKSPHAMLNCSGLDVGLPEGQMGNSEVGHLNLGAGRIIYQELTRITKSISDGDFFDNIELNNAIDNAINHNSSIHLMGLLSDGGVHSHIEHLYALLKMIKKRGVRDNVFIHCFLDGRDTPPTSGINYIIQLEEQIKVIGVGAIASVSGRYYAMDRDNRWERVKLAYDAMINNTGKFANTALEAVRDSYKDQINDEFVLPTIIGDKNDKRGQIKEQDSVVFFNFRPDRARQMSRVLTDQNFNSFVRKKGYQPLHFVSLTQYDTTLDQVHVAYKPQTITHTLGQVISEHGLTQLRIAETEKYAHVTYFFNGGEEKEYVGEDRILVPSPQVVTYDLKPEMSAYEVAQRAVKAISEKDYSLIVLNFANCDMVGHTGIFEAAVKAVETVDECLGKVVAAIEKKGGCALITADHGNAEQMLEITDDKPFTAHTTNQVKCILAGKNDVSLVDGKLADLAPTILDILNIGKPLEMTGVSIIK
ncbi:2,3-bisphosphoglycerate-independent phosphoglycerate mutase [Alkalibaculum sp. M08DMB]|uniref:2,3-bisphosphoglycerate-independent phosphoglycerate mutase n=1 Tax=Alkalibaculum sporogenes TaxID=2655001 RepID=A0A6A7KA63_9FIRM|nr:2,3-bisphosphoglycerate-independent phosphoglycerate mutase [Alkalibaculum sporogenes]MPW25933.1 2,3-bisphosphoglycerate-independent phosphoglycerate mutase [Alkalibaculum sporogenes]